MLDGVMFINLVQTDRVLRIVFVQVVSHKMRDEETEARREIVRGTNGLIELGKRDILAIVWQNAYGPNDKSTAFEIGVG